MSLDTHAAGSILFNRDISRDVIAEFMYELKDANPNFVWIDLHMRDAGGETLMAYRVDFKQVSKNMPERFHQQLIGRLFKRFGESAYKKPLGVKMWSLSDVLVSVT